MVPESVINATMADMDAVRRGMEGITVPDTVLGLFDWLTSVLPPLAGMLHITGSPQNGIDMLAMCVADRFFRSVNE